MLNHLKLFKKLLNHLLLYLMTNQMIFKILSQDYKIKFKNSELELENF